MADDDGWIVVGKGGKSPKKRKTKHQPRHSEADEDIPFLGDYANPAVCCKSIHLLTDKLKTSGFFSSLQASFQKARPGFPEGGVHTIRCYGTGSPCKSLEARSQLALLPLLRELLSSDTSQVAAQVFDPVFTDADKKVIHELGGTVLTAEAASQHACTEGVLFYMPHCDASLYNEVLESNWGIEGLSRLCVLGNSFAHMEDRWSMPTFKRRAGKPHRVIALVEHGLVQEQKLPGSEFAVQTAFNDTSFHWFIQGDLQQAPDLFKTGTAM